VPSINWWAARKTEIPWAVWLALCSVNRGLLACVDKFIWQKLSLPL
jgi:hypothetical protein